MRALSWPWVLCGLQLCAAKLRLFAVSLSHLQGVLFHEGQSFGVVPPVSDAAGQGAASCYPLPAWVQFAACWLAVRCRLLLLATVPCYARVNASCVPGSNLPTPLQGTKINSKGQEVPETVRLYSIASSRYGDRHDGKTCTLCVVRVVWRGEHAVRVGAGTLCNMCGQVGRRQALVATARQRGAGPGMRQGNTQTSSGSVHSRLLQDCGGLLLLAAVQMRRARCTAASAPTTCATSRLAIPFR